MKTCSTCKKERSEEDFSFQRNKCKQCRREENQEKREKFGPPPPSPQTVFRTTKVCSDCQKEKPASDFYPHKGHSDRLASKCSVCDSARKRVQYLGRREKVLLQQKLRRDANPDVKMRQRKNGRAYYYRLKLENPDKLLLSHRRQKCKGYGITLEEFDALKTKQSGVCAICFRPVRGGRGELRIDHDHTTGKIRGLLCHHCNLGLGQFEDSPEFLKSAISYLTAFGDGVS